MSLKFQSFTGLANMFFCPRKQFCYCFGVSLAMASSSEIWRASSRMARSTALVHGCRGGHRWFGVRTPVDIPCGKSISNDLIVVIGVFKDSISVELRSWQVLGGWKQGIVCRYGWERVSAISRPQNILQAKLPSEDQNASCELMSFESLTHRIRPPSSMKTICSKFTEDSKWQWVVEDIKENVKGCLMMFSGLHTFEFGGGQETGRL